MRKYIGSILMVAAIVGLTTGVQAEEFINVQNASESSQFAINHNVARESYFKTVVKTSQINSDALRETNLGEFRLRNNTRDGFELTISSATGGVLQPSGSSSDRLDGEVDIPYTVNITKAGEIGTGIDSFLSFASNALANAVTGIDAAHILKKAGVDGSSAVSSVTDAIFQLNIKMESNTDALGMAGTYADVLTLTYTDL